MRFWTVQSNDVAKLILETGFFQPDFSKSYYLTVNPKLSELFYFILNNFNKINNSKLPGLVFAFAQSNNESIYSIANLDEFKTFIRNKQQVIYSLWKHLIRDNAVILELDYPELDYPEKFNPLYVDINDFQFLMPPIVTPPPYTASSVFRICRDMSLGMITHSEMPSGVIQAHLPFITADNLVSIYPVFDVEQ